MDDDINESIRWMHETCDKIRREQQEMREDLQRIEFQMDRNKIRIDKLDKRIDKKFPIPDI